MKTLTTLKDIKETADSILKSECLLEKDKASKKTSCEYFIGGERFCKITSQLSCRGCRFYSASAIAKKRALIYHIFSQEETIKNERSKYEKYVEETEPYVKAYERIMSAKTR